MLRLIRFVLFLVHLILLCGLSLMLLNRWVPPAYFKWFNFIPLAFPVLMSAYLLLTVFWLLGFKKRGILFLIAGLFFFNPVRRWVNFNKEQTLGTLKVMSFNMHSSNHLAEKKAFLKASGADLIFLQEKGTPKKMAEKLKLSEYPYHLEDRVTLLLSKYPIKQSEIIVDSGNGHGGYADIEINGKTIRFINIYLEPFYLEKFMVKPTSDSEVNKQKADYLKGRLYKSFRWHQAQIKEILPYIEKSPYPVILGGDFNSVPNSYEYYQLSSGLKDAFVEAGKGSGTSFHDFKYPLRIDYLFSSPEIQARSYQVLRDVQLSDHFPVLATFDLPQ